MKLTAVVTTCRLIFLDYDLLCCWKSFGRFGGTTTRLQHSEKRNPKIV